jgi:exosome complex component RRP45
MKRLKQRPNISNNEENFILDSLESNMRVYCRSSNDYREVAIEFSEQFGQCIVKLGKTKVLSVVTCEAVEPFPDKPNDGFLFFNVDLSPMASEEFDNSKRHEYSIELARIVERALRGSKAIDTEALCIVARKKVWSVRVDITVIDHFGNLNDACHLAAISSLLHFKRPEVTIQGEGYKIHSVTERNAVPLSIHHIPICVTFAFFEGETMVVDPDLNESLISSGMMTIAVNTHSEVCGVQKAGGIPIDLSEIIACTKTAAVKAQEITKILKLALANDEKERKVKATPEYARIHTTTKQVDKMEEVELSEEEMSSESSGGEEMDEIEEDSPEEEVKPVKKVVKPQTNAQKFSHNVSNFKKTIQEPQKEIKVSKPIETPVVVKSITKAPILKPVVKKPISKEPIDLTAAIKKKK